MGCCNCFSSVTCVIVAGISFHSPVVGATTFDPELVALSFRRVVTDGESSIMFANFSGVAGATMVDDDVGITYIIDVLGVPADDIRLTLNLRSARGSAVRFGVLTMSVLELSELRMSLFLVQNRFFNACFSLPNIDIPPVARSAVTPTTPLPSDGDDGLPACSRLRFAAIPSVPVATAAVDTGGPLPPASSSESSLHCFLIRSASSSSLLIRLRDISFSASSTLRVGVVSNSAHGVMTRFSASDSSPPALGFETVAVPARPPNNESLAMSPPGPERNMDPVRKMLLRLLACSSDFSGAAIRIVLKFPLRRAVLFAP